MSMSNIEKALFKNMFLSWITGGGEVPRQSLLCQLQAHCEGQVQILVPPLYCNCACSGIVGTSTTPGSAAARAPWQVKTTNETQL